MAQENSVMLKWQNMSEMQKSFNISHIKMFKGDALYDDYRAMPNVEIVNENSEDEYIVFHTINSSLAKCMEKSAVNKPTKQEISECIAYFESREIHAYEHYGSVYVNFDMEDISVEISSAEIIERAEMYRQESSANIIRQCEICGDEMHLSQDEQSVIYCGECAQIDAKTPCFI